eukprot:TRINITY_DN15830_c0_g1_i4.p1 TRINITY_DN15830_c0_g1~~TRINITY_DN15830_c0_g1_i4.p1  ORF type:complete len:300 (+),score=43.94 TRINITY_DN15830_c0_g1_i4:24-902(+)
MTSEATIMASKETPVTSNNTDVSTSKYVKIASKEATDCTVSTQLHDASKSNLRKGANNKLEPMSNGELDCLGAGNDVTDDADHAEHVRKLRSHMATAFADGTQKVDIPAKAKRKKRKNGKVMNGDSLDDAVGNLEVGQKSKLRSKGKVDSVENAMNIKSLSATSKNANNPAENTSLEGKPADNVIPAGKSNANKIWAGKSSEEDTIVAPKLANDIYSATMNNGHCSKNGVPNGVILNGRLRSSFKTMSLDRLAVNGRIVTGRFVAADGQKSVLLHRPAVDGQHNQDEGCIHI